MGRVIHFEVHCGDPDRAERFYTHVFGWQIRRYEGAPVDYRLITTGTAGEAGIDGALVERRGGIDGQAVIAYVCTIGVDDISRTEALIAEAGGTPALPRAEVPGVGQLSYWKDTEGNVFGVLQPVG